VRIADDPDYSGKPVEFFRGTLCVTTGDDDAGAWLRSMDLANGVPCLCVGGSCDSTRIHDDEVGASGIRHLFAATSQ